MVAALQPLRAQEICDLIGAADSTANDNFVSLLLPASTIHSAGRSLLSGLRASSASNQSSAQLNGAGSGQRNPATALS